MVYTFAAGAPTVGAFAIWGRNALEVKFIEMIQNLKFHTDLSLLCGVARIYSLYPVLISLLATSVMQMIHN